MCRSIGRRATFSTGILLALLVAALAVPSRGATFGLGTLIEVGLSNSTANGAVLAAGNDGSAAGTSGNAASFQNNTGRWFQIVYQKPTNTLQVQIFNGSAASGPSTTLNYNPAGGAAVAANAIWTIPASAFFVTASSAPILNSSISISNLTLSGISGALNIISPMQQTSLTASRGFLGATVTSVQSGDIVFQGDSNGSWMLSGLLTVTGLLTPPFGPTGTNLEFGFSASANAGSPVPETSSLPLMGTGLAVLIVFGRKKAKALRL